MKINKNITPFNRWIGRDGQKVEWIVLHYTANTYQPDLAKNECAAFANRYVGASAHFFVDEKEVWQSVAVEDTAWHCGDNPPPKNGCTNRNSIGIEMCVRYKESIRSPRRRWTTPYRLFWNCLRRSRKQNCAVTTT